MHLLWQGLRCLYSAVHICHFFHMAVVHIAVSLTQLFNFIIVSQQGNKVEHNFIYHLSRFLHVRESQQTSHNALMTFVALNILLDAYPSKMHSKIALQLMNLNAKCFAKICSLWFRDSLWCLVSAILYSISHEDVWWSGSHLTAEHFHLKSTDHTVLWYDYLWEVSNTDISEKDEVSRYQLSVD